jgi:hypothetical protein
MTAKPYGTSNGVPITDELIERAAAEAEAGYDPDQLTPRPTGRPLIGAAPAKGLPVRFPPELRHQLQERAEAEHVTEADVVRRAVADYLTRSA